MKKVIIFTMLSICILIQTPKASAIILNDGGVHDIYGPVEGIILVQDNEVGEGTTVNLMPGSYVINEIEAWGHSEISISGGSVQFMVTAIEHTHVTMSGGSIGSSFGVTVGDGRIIMSGGEVGGDLWAASSTNIILTGGLITEEIKAWASSIIEIHGSNFKIDGLDVGYGAIAANSGVLTGILAGGDMINNNFAIHDDAAIVLVPEPSTLFLIGLGCLALLKKRRA